MKYTDYKVKDTPISIRIMISALKTSATLNNRGNKQINYLKKTLFSKKAFFNEFSLSEETAIWQGIRVDRTNTEIIYILLKNTINGKELRISPSKLLRRIEGGRFEIKQIEFKAKELKF